MKELIITKDNLTKNYLENISQSLIQRVKDGEYDAIEVYIQLKAYEKVISETIKEIQHDAITEAENYGKLERIKFGVSFELTSGRATYDFEADEEFRQLNEKLKTRRVSLTDAAKAKLKGQLVIDANGEQIQPPPMKEGSKFEGIRITFK